MTHDDQIFATRYATEVGERIRVAFWAIVKGDYVIREKGEHEIRLENEIDEFYRTQIARAYPHYAVASRENPLPTAETAMWTIDSIDGGANFIRGIPFFCTALSLIEQGAVRLSVVFDPIHGEMFVGIPGRGAYLNGKAIHVSQESHLPSALVGITAIEHHQLSIRRLFEPLHREAWAITGQLSAILSACYVAVGRLDAQIFNGRRIWDLAPSAGMVEAAGGVASDIHGRPWQPPSSSEGAIYANSELHQAIIRLIE